MGLLTPILFRNDHMSLLDSEPEQVIDAIKEAMSAYKSDSYSIKKYRRPKWYQFWKKKEIGEIIVNPIEALPAKHSSESSTIVMNGNIWQDLTAVRFSGLEVHNLSYIEDCIKIAQKDITALKKMIKEKRCV